WATFSPPRSIPWRRRYGRGSRQHLWPREQTAS
ncbi:MAG: hypothetical protein AVDCRST_MAG93-5026, partial [uncultured Chloroflexia bacterium]